MLTFLPVPDSSMTTWDNLTPDLLRRIAGFLPPNEVVCTLRLVRKALAELLRDRGAIRLSLPVPPQAFAKRWGSPDVSMRDLTLKQRRRLLALTARSGVLVNLHVALAASGCSLTQEVFDAAAAGGSLEVCQWLLDMRCPMGSKTVAAALAAGHLGLVLYLLQQQLQSPDHGSLVEAAWKAAARTGDRALCEGLMTAGLPCPHSAVFAAACRGHTDFFEWLLQLPERPPLDKFGLMNLLVSSVWGFDLPALQRLYRSQQVLHSRPLAGVMRNGRMTAAAISSPSPDWRDKLQWLTAEGARCNAVVVRYGADVLRRPDSLERLQLLLQHWAGLSAQDMGYLADAAVRAANLPALRYLCERCLGKYYKRHFTLAALSGDVALLAELLELGCPLGQDAVLEAAGNGHLAAVEWFAGPEAGPAGGEAELQRASGQLTRFAAKSGSMELMSWLRGRGYPWADGTFAAAAEAGNVALLEWLAAEGCPMGPGEGINKASEGKRPVGAPLPLPMGEGEPYQSAAFNGDMATLRCLRRLGCPWGSTGEVFNSGLHRGYSLEVVRWLVEEGCPLDWRLVRRRLATVGPYAFEFDPEVRAWLESHVPLECG